MKNTEFKIDLTKEMAWVTFSEENWEMVWHPIMMNGKQLQFDSYFIMEIAKERWSDKTFGIAPTSQILLKNAVKDNI
jgi:hypothetical protein